MAHEAWLWLLFGAFCLTIGSFLNVVIYRLPLMLMQPECGLSLALPASHCPCCRSPVRWRDNLPLLGWLLLGGRCRACRQPISRRYPLTEATALCIGIVLALIMPPHLLPWTLLLCWTLLALSQIDLMHQLLPDVLTLPLLWLALVLHSFNLLPGNLADAVLGAAGGYLLFWLLAQGYRWLRGIEALGLGDAKLLAALGAWLGWQPLPQLLLIAASGGIITLLLGYILRRRPLQQALPFGPWLGLAGALLFIFRSA